MATIRLFIKYWGKIIFESIKATGRTFDVRGNYLSGCSLLLLLLIVSFLSSSALLNFAGIDVFLTEIKSEMRLFVLMALIFLVLVFVINLAYMPAKIYDEMGGFVGRPLKLSPDSMSRGYVSLKVENETPYEVVDCTLQLNDVFHIHRKESVLHRAENLTWSSREHADGPGNQPKLVTKINPRWCDIAEAKPSANQAAFTLWPPAKPQAVGAGQYLLTILISGRWQDKPFINEWYFTLQYRNGDDIQLYSGDDHEE